MYSFFVAMGACFIADFLLNKFINMPEKLIEGEEDTVVRQQKYSEHIAFMMGLPWGLLMASYSLYSILSNPREPNREFTKGETTLIYVASM